MIQKGVGVHGTTMPRLLFQKEQSESPTVGIGFGPKSIVYCFWQSFPCQGVLASQEFVSHGCHYWKEGTGPGTHNAPHVSRVRGVQVQEDKTSASIRPL